MSRVLAYITSSVWAMRQAEFDTMTLVAVRKLDALEKIASEIDDKKFDTMLAKRGERLMNTSYVQMREGSVAVIDVNGRLAKRMDMFTEVCEGGTSTEKLLKDFQTCLENPNVASIVFHIDSPGGEAFGINELSQHIFAARGRKPMKAYISGLGCSGAYWIASACDEIITDKSAFLGSIGVVSVWIDDTEAYAMLGFDKKTVVSSNAPKKRLDLNKPADYAEFQSELDSMEKVFIGTVARNRKKNREQVINDFNQGGVLSGDAAVKVGMADRTGSLEQVIKELARKGKTSAVSAEGEFDMGFKEEFKAFAVRHGLIKADEENALLETAAENAEEPAAAVAETPALEAAAAEPNADTEVEKANLAAEKEKLFTEKAKVFADAEVSANRLLPAERDEFEAAYLQALKTDAANPESPSMAAYLEGMQSKRQPHHFTTETIAPDATARILTGERGNEISEERQTELLNKTPLGKAALSVIKGGKSETAK